MFPYAPHLAFWQTYYTGISENMFIWSTGGGKTIGTKGNIDVMKNLKPSWLIGTPSYTYHVLKNATESGERIRSIRKILLGAARVPPGFKRKLSNILEKMGGGKVQIIGTYGFTESKMAWCECPTDIDISSGYHTYPDLGIFEVIDPDTEEVLPEGSDGELVYTCLDARGTCVIRYRTRDFVEGGISYDPCPYCGITAPRISSSISRRTSIKSMKISKVKGTLINFDNLELLLQDFEDIDEYLVEIRKKDDDPFEVDVLHLFFNPMVNAGDLNQLKNKINESLMARMEISFNVIEILSQSEMYQKLELEEVIKVKRVRDERPQS